MKVVSRATFKKMGARRSFKNFDSDVVGPRIDAMIGLRGVPGYPRQDIKLIWLFRNKTKALLCVVWVVHDNTLVLTDLLLDITSDIAFESEHSLRTDNSRETVQHEQSQPGDFFHSSPVHKLPSWTYTLPFCEQNHPLDQYRRLYIYQFDGNNLWSILENCQDTAKYLEFTSS